MAGPVAGLVVVGAVASALLMFGAVAWLAWSIYTDRARVLAPGPLPGMVPGPLPRTPPDEPPGGRPDVMNANGWVVPR